MNITGISGRERVLLENVGDFYRIRLHLFDIATSFPSIKGLPCASAPHTVLGKDVVDITATCLSPQISSIPALMNSTEVLYFPIKSNAS